MTEKGYPQFTVREVAQRAGVGPALVSYYFGGKTGLFAAIIEQVVRESGGRMQRAAAAEGTVEERTKGAIRELVGAMRDHPYLPRLMMEQVIFAEQETIDRFAREFASPNFTTIRELLIQGSESGELRKVDPMLVVPSMIGACVYFFLAAPLLERMSELEGHPSENSEFAESTAMLLLEGLKARGPKS